MAKKAKTNARKKAQKARAQAAPADPTFTRRRVMGMAKGGAVGAVALLGAGYIGTRMFRGYQSEHDLTRIGQGIPAVVQVHDPQCPECTELQRETRKAMNEFDEDNLLYLVADLNQAKGQAFARQHNVSRVTLVLMDARGERTQVLRGVRTRVELKTALASHVAAHGRRG